MAWYLLAEAEIMSGINAGIFRNLRSCLQCGPIQFLEMTIRKKPIDASVLRIDFVQFAKSFRGHLEGLAFLAGLPKSFRETFDVMNPDRGEVPALSPEALAENENTRRAAIMTTLAFAISAALSGEFDKIDRAEQELASEMGSGFPGRTVFERLRGEGLKIDELSEALVDIIVFMKKNQHLVPSDVCGAVLRFSEFARKSEFKFVLIPMLLNWFVIRWQTILANERFRLNSPAVNVPIIESIINSDLAAGQKLRKLLLAGCDATGLSLADEYRELLRQQSLPPVESAGSGDS
jgi:hypothetical protein